MRPEAERIKISGSIALVVLLLVVFSPGVLLGAAPSFNLSIDLREEYNNNIYYSKATKQDDWITDLSTKLKWTVVNEKIKASASAGVTRKLYRENDSEDQTDQVYGVAVDYKMNERLILSPRAAYLKDSSRGRDIETTGLVQSDLTRENWQYGVSGNYILTEKDSLNFSTGYEKDAYEQTDDSDFNSWNLALSYLRYLDPKTQGSLQVGYATYDYLSADIENYWVSIGADRQLNETFSLNCHIGQRYTRMKQTAIQIGFPAPFYLPVFRQVTSKEDSSGFIGGFGITYQGETSRLRLSMAHDLKSASGRNGTTNRTDMVLSANQRLTEDWDIFLTGGYYINKANAGELAGEDIDERTFLIQPGVGYRINRNLKLDGLFRYIEIEDKNEHSTINNASGMLQIGFNCDLLD